MVVWVENKLYVFGPSSTLKRFEHDIHQQTKKLFVKDRNPSKVSWGRCKFWNEDKGFGFIKCEHYASNALNVHSYEDSDDDDYCNDRRDDVFVHCSQLKCGTNGARVLKEGELVSFEIVVQSDGRKKAINVTGPKGRYISGDHDFIPFQRDDNKEQCIPLFGTQERIGFKVESMDNYKSITVSFSSKCNAPESWLKSMAATYYTLSFKLRFEVDHKSVGYIVYQKGQCIHNRAISLSDIWTTYTVRLKSYLLKQWQNVYHTPIRIALKSYHIGSDLQTVILSFMPIHIIDELDKVDRAQFMKNWKHYKEYNMQQDKQKGCHDVNLKKIEVLIVQKKKIEEEVRNIGVKWEILDMSDTATNQSQGLLLEKIKVIEMQINKYKDLQSASSDSKCHISPFHGVFSDFFDKMQQKVDSILNDQDIEILDYQKSIQSAFWGSDTLFDSKRGIFSRLLDVLDIYPHDHMEPIIVQYAKKGDLLSIKKHIANGGDVDRRMRWVETETKYGGYDKSWDWFSASALMIAAKDGHHKIVEVLLMAGADPMLKSYGCNDESYDAMEVAQSASKLNGSGKRDYIVSIIGAVNALWRKWNPSSYESCHFKRRKGLKGDIKNIPTQNDIKQLIDSFKYSDFE